MSDCLIKNIKVENVLDQDISTLDLDKATAFELNMFVGFLLGKLSVADFVNPRIYDIGQFDLSFYSPMGMTTVIPDYYNDHAEAHTLFSHHNIVIVNDYNDEKGCSNGYIAAKMVFKNGMIIQNPVFEFANSSSLYLNECGLKTLIKVLSYNQFKTLRKLHLELNK